MRKISLLFSLLLLIFCFAACKNTDVYLSETDLSVPDTSSGFEIIITDDSSTTSNTVSTASTQSELEQIADDWEKVEVELETVTPSSKAENASQPTTNSEEKTSSAVSASKPESSGPAAQNSSVAEQSSSENSSVKESSSSESASSKVTSLPDYYEGRY